MEKIAFCVITFDPIKIQTHSAPQNDRLNFSFVKDIHVDGGNLAWNSCKTAICQSAFFGHTLRQEKFFLQLYEYKQISFSDKSSFVEPLKIWFSDCIP